MARYATRYYDDVDRRRHALGADRGDRADPARGQRADGRVHGASSCSSAAWTSGSNTRVESLRRRARRALRRRGVRRRDDRVDRRRQAQPDADPHRPAAGREGPAALHARPAGRRASRTPGARATAAAVPDLDRARARSPARRPSTRSGRRKTLARQHRRGAAPAARRADYRHKYVGSVASLGLYRGVAEVYGIKLRGWLAWFMHRTYHVSRMPTVNRKVRVLADWTLAHLLPARGGLARPAAAAAARVRAGRAAGSGDAARRRPRGQLTGPVLRTT